MKKINRIKILFAITFVIFGLLAIYSNNPYFNAFIIGITFVIYIIIAAYLCDNMNSKEYEFMKKITGYFAEENDED